jgi:hypothetical protein
MDQLRVLAAGAGGEVPLLDQADAQPKSGMLSAQRKIADYPRSVNSSAQHQNVKIRLLKEINLLIAEAGHPLASLEHVRTAEKTCRA